MFPELGVKRALLLQGPMGPFFQRFARDLRDAGIEVTKVNLNAGDALFYPRGALAYRGTPERWPDFLGGLIRARGIDGIFVFGDGRPYHRQAIELARRLGVAVFVFEEGYLRPDYITLERDGVNGYSQMPKDPAVYRALALPEGEAPERPLHVGATFGRAAWFSTLYSLALTLGFFAYPHYRHHRPLNAWAEAFRWVRGGLRKLRYRFDEREVSQRLVTQHRHQYFLVALQVHQDFQLQHSRFRSVPAFIEEVVASFAAHAPAQMLLVIKHHPMDRAYADYGPLIARLTERHKLDGRVLYVHDLHLPTLLRNARGAVMINSTVGLSSLQYGTPVKVLGAAVYDMEGLTCQAPLEQFWNDPGKIDPLLCRGFRRYLLQHNQINGSFYRPLPELGGATGLGWFPHKS
jgi:capsule polysaccharide modification protein KpsS